MSFAQSAEDKARFEALGVPSERVRAAGNLKFDSAPGLVTDEELASMRESAGIRAGRAVWIGGSTHEGEEGVLLGVHQELRSVYPDLLLILAPRHIERAGQVAALAGRMGLPAAIRSRNDSAQDNAVYILDTLGELGRFYGLAAAAFIGGSLVPFGGHNPLEPVAQGKTRPLGPSSFQLPRDGIQPAASGMRPYRLLAAGTQRGPCANGWKIRGCGKKARAGRCTSSSPTQGAAGGSRNSSRGCRRAKRRAIFSEKNPRRTRMKADSLIRQGARHFVFARSARKAHTRSSTDVGRKISRPGVPRGTGVPLRHPWGRGWETPSRGHSIFRAGSFQIMHR